MSARERLDEIERSNVLTSHKLGMLAALRAVLDIHTIDEPSREVGPFCSVCDDHGGYVDWPCPTVQAIEEHLK